MVFQAHDLVINKHNDVKKIAVIYTHSPIP